MATESNNQDPVITTVSFARDDGECDTEFTLAEPVVVHPCCMSKYAVCRICASRLPIRTLEKVILHMVIDDAECNIRVPRSYAELGRIVGKGTHSVERAVAELRHAGLVLTTRVGRSCAAVAFNCDAFIRWAEDFVGSRPAVQTANAPSEPPNAPEAVVAPKKRTVAKKEKMASKKVDATVEPSFEEQLAEARKFDMMGLDPNNLPPGCFINKDGRVSFDFKSGHPVPPQFQVSADDTEVDASAERNSTIALAGDRKNDDEDDISFGSDTDETDIGHGVVCNPDL